MRQAFANAGYRLAGLRPFGDRPARLVSDAQVKRSKTVAIAQLWGGGLTVMGSEPFIYGAGTGTSIAKVALLLGATVAVRGVLQAAATYHARP